MPPAASELPTEKLAPSASVPQWRGFARLAAPLLLTAVLYGEILKDLALDWWREPALSHGLLIPPLALAIAWIRRVETFAFPAQQDWRGLGLTLAACILLLLGRLGAEFFLCRISFVLLLAGFVWTFCGLARLRTLAFPFVLLATMVPLPSILYNSIAAPLQLFASEASAWLVQGLGVTVLRDGNLIHLARITLGVEEACSGLSSLSTLIVASLLLGFLSSSSAWVRLLLFALSIPVAIAANVLRVAGTALIADHRPELAMGFYHLFSGWLVFLIGLGLLYGLSALLNALWRTVK